MRFDELDNTIEFYEACLVEFIGSDTKFQNISIYD